MATVLGEAEAEACITALEAEDHLLISAAAVAEALIVGARQGVGDEMESVLESLGLRGHHAHRSYGTTCHTRP